MLQTSHLAPLSFCSRSQPERTDDDMSDGDLEERKEQHQKPKKKSAVKRGKPPAFVPGRSQVSQWE